MPSVDEQLSRALREAAPRPTTSGLDQRLARRRRTRAFRRRLGTGALAMVVLAGTAAGFFALSDAFGSDQVRESSPSVVPGPKENGPLVVVADGDLGTHLELDPLDGSAAVRLTDPREEIVRDPAPAPDGHRVAFVSLGPDEGLPVSLVVLNVLTGERSLVADDVVADPAWSPDGGSIAYEGVLDGRIGLVTVDLVTGERRFVTEGADPSWSPDGATIAFELPSDRPAARVGEQGIFTVPATGGEPTPVIESGASPSWSPDGSMLAFTRIGGVWVARADGAEPRLLIGHTPDEVPLGLIDPGFADPSWAPDGSRLMYTYFTPQRSWIDSIAPGDDAVWRLVPGGTDAAWLPLVDPEKSPEPGSEPAQTLPGVPFAVCRVTSVTGDFGEGLDTAWVFEEEHTPGSGCDRSEGFQHLAVGSADRVAILSRRLTDVLNDDAWRVWAFAAPDLNGDGTDEIAIARQGGEPQARHLWLFRVAAGEVVPITEDCGPACWPAPWNVEIGPALHENGVVTDSGLTCGIPGGRAEDRDALILWQADTEDPLHVYLSKWRFDGAMLEPIGDGELFIQGTPGAFPPSGFDELCGSPTNQTVDFPAYVDQRGTSPQPSTLCNTSSMTGDVNGDGADDLVAIGSVVSPRGCPTEGQQGRILTIDLDGDLRADVETDAIDCSTWCFPFVAFDLSNDGTAEILVNEGHTAPPASAVIAVYELVDDRLEPVLFPNDTNRFLLVNSWQGYHGAYCKEVEDRFTTWSGGSDEEGGNVTSITFREYRLDADPLRFELMSETPVEAFGDALPPRGYRGYDGLFCGAEVEPLG